jgi:hypothetical protein
MLKAGNSDYSFQTRLGNRKSLEEALRYWEWFTIAFQDYWLIIYFDSSLIVSMELNAGL